MSLENELTQLELDFQGGPVAARREAVAKAAQMLRRRDCDAGPRQRIVALLQHAATHDLPTVRDAAQTVLDNLAAGYDPALLADDRKHMIGVHCQACGHVTYFDKRRLCTDRTTFYRTVVRSEGRVLDEVHIRCARCDAEMVVRLDCGAYS